MLFAASNDPRLLVAIVMIAAGLLCSTTPSPYSEG
jgi:hypothetical protein